MPTNDFLAFGTGPGANVLTQGAYAALAARSAGFSSGLAKSNELNKVWRQSALMSASVAEYIAGVSGDNVLDNGLTADKVTSLAKAISSTARGSMNWNNTDTYVPNQPVFKDGTLYISLTTNSNSSPPSADWLSYGNGRLSLTIAGAAGATLSAIQNTYRHLDFTGLLTGNSNIVVLATTPRMWLITNNTTGAFTLTVKTAAGTGVVVPQGYTQMVFTDGVNVLPAGPAIAAAGAVQLAGPLNGNARVSVASAASVNLDTAAANYIQITGTTTITALTLANGSERVLVFAGDLTLTNGASLIIPGAANLSVGAGDIIRVIGEAAGVVRVINIERAGTGFFRRFYESPQQTITSAGLLTLPHNLGLIPVTTYLELVCVTAESGYVSGDRVLAFPNSSSAGTSRASAVYYDATNINIRFSSGADVFMVVNKTTGVYPTTFTNANWRLVVRAWA